MEAGNLVGVRITELTKLQEQVDRLPTDSKEPGELVDVRIASSRPTRPGGRTGRSGSEAKSRSHVPRATATEFPSSAPATEGPKRHDVALPSPRASHDPPEALGLLALGVREQVEIEV
jgi:hypothetical protein